jgi:transcriptional regulator with XRE-family HTH domain
MLTPAQLKAARALVGYTREDLAAKSGVFANTIKNFENGTSDPKRSTMLSWKRALEQASVEFLEPTDDGKSEGVRFKSAKGKR